MPLCTCGQCKGTALKCREAATVRKSAVDSLVSELESQCNRYVNETCLPHACLTRGGWKRGMAVNPEMATCKCHERAVALMELLSRFKEPQ